VGVVVGLIMALASAIIPNLESGSPVSVREPSEPLTATEAPQQPTVTQVESLVGQLTVAPEGPREGYERQAFKHWVDADQDGCDTREEVLIEESLIPATTEVSGCSVTAGEWFSPYDTMTFVAPGGLDIDHVVPLGEAWDSGASAWDTARRQDYANDLEDPQALIAVSAGSNRSKSDRDPAEWQPPSVEYWCTYVSDWVTVKVVWGLSADEAEVQALRDMLVTCAEGS
jgi:hypothetical protein